MGGPGGGEEQVSGVCDVRHVEDGADVRQEGAVWREEEVQLTLPGVV